MISPLTFSSIIINYVSHHTWFVKSWTKHWDWLAHTSEFVTVINMSMAMSLELYIKLKRVVSINTTLLIIRT